MYTLDHLQLRTLQLIEVKLLKHAEIRMVENLVEDAPPAVRVRVEQGLCRDAIGEQKDGAQQ